MSRVSMLEELPGMELLLLLVVVAVGAMDTRRFFAGVDDDGNAVDAAFAVYCRPPRDLREEAVVVVGGKREDDPPAAC